MFETEVRLDNIQIHSRCDFAEFVGAGRSHTIEFTPIEKVFRIYDELDPWSSLVVSNDLAVVTGRSKQSRQLTLTFG
ncbi:MAG: hypothetical protein DYG93_06360 [Leptolyngbya sp. PLA2]|nr:hypothetical protein [Leptolyngbya sp. PL-A2]MCQ3939630.1 hypothetical protein [cyanobacterium CYA1]